MSTENATKNTQNLANQQKHFEICMLEKSPYTEQPQSVLPAKEMISHDPKGLGRASIEGSNNLKFFFAPGRCLVGTNFS